MLARGQAVLLRVDVGAAVLRVAGASASRVAAWFASRGGRHVFVSSDERVSVFAPFGQPGRGEVS